MVSNPERLPPAVFLMGPTAAGKTAVAMALADARPVRLISVDSAQVYRGLDIGAAKPDRETLAQYPHALIDIREPEETYSAADFAADAAGEIRAAHRAGAMPVLVGGTVLYFRALLYGLDRMPPADQNLRAEIEAEAGQRGWASLHHELGRHDPAAAARIRPADQQRILRAIEVLRLTGKGPSSHYSDNRVPRMDSLRLVLTPSDRHVLHDRIERRFDQMLDEDLLAEVTTLRRRPALTVDHAAMRSVGYRQLWRHLDGQYDLATARAKGVAATRQLAKRQLTALRQMPGALWNDPLQMRTIDLIFRQVGEFSKHCRFVEPRPVN